MYIHYKIAKRKKINNFFLFIFYRYHRIFFGSLIFKGRKLWAFKFFLELKHELKIKEKIESNILFFFSLIHITPTVLLSPYKIGGKVQGVPLSISWSKKLIFATKWVIKLLKDKFNTIKLNNLADILILATYNKGLSIKKKKHYNLISSSNKYLIKYFKK